ncbi:MAG TPA: hypothetical protein VHZ25_12270 [Acidobacteriaceae bacterium]|nr:hypothetical protein [Acidobacteriaceae bacterium]
MKTRLMLAACVLAALSSSSLLAQELFGANRTVAYVYVTSTPANASASEIDAYSASANGKLTPIPGSPFQENDSALAVNGLYLFGLNRDTTTIDSLAVELNGALRYVTSTNWAVNNPNDCGFAGSLFTDRTGLNLYDLEFDGDCANNGYQSYRNKLLTGGLSYLGYANGGAGSFDGVSLPATVLGNNRFAYTATNNGCFYFGVQGFARSANGLLSDANIGTTLPAPPDGYRGYIPTFAAADPTNHVAIALWAANPPGCGTNSQQIGSFTADNNGNLTTTNTSANMPTTLVTSIQDLKVSPSGKLLAVGGQGGLQFFHFNGANPPTAFTPLLTTDDISQMFWDNANHLYAISQQTGTLHVFNVTPTAYSEAAGSPYTVSQPGSIAVQARTLILP